MKILYIPDNQVRPGDDLEYLRCIGRLIVTKKPDVVVSAGDFGDMPSLSLYDRNKRSFEGRRYKADVAAVHAGMEALLGPLKAYNEMRLKNKKALYRPRLVITMGNHEDRINRAANDDPMLDGTISTDDLAYSYYGWEVIPFLEVEVIGGVAFSHYFSTGAMGRPAASAQAQLTKKMMSTVAGHQQGLSMATSYRADGKRVTAIIAGSCYEHQEKYLNPQGNKHWHGVIMMHNVNDGEFDPTCIPLHYLKSKYAAD